LLKKVYLKYLDDYCVKKISGEEFLNLIFGELGLNPKGYGHLLKTPGKLNSELLLLFLMMAEKPNYTMYIALFPEFLKYGGGMM